MGQPPDLLGFLVRAGLTIAASEQNRVSASLASSGSQRVGIVDPVRGPWLGTILDNAILLQIGRIGLAWATVDQSIKAAIAVFQIEHANVPRDTTNFRKCLSAFRVGCQAEFSKHPKIIEAYRAISDETAEIAWRRNTLLHGKVIYVVPSSGEPFIEATGRHNGKPVSIKANAKDLWELSRRIDHVAVLLLRPTVLGPLVGEPEEAVLREFEGRIHRLQANPDRP